MKYTGQFRSIHRDKLYTVNIITDNDISSTREITLGPNPFETNMDQSDNTIFTPIKASEATIEIVSDPIFFDLYSSSAKENKVELLDASGNVEWIGYTTPNSYSTPFDFSIEKYEVECLDALAILQYYDYTPCDGSIKNFKTFAEIIDHILSKTGIITNWYWNNSTQINAGGGNYLPMPSNATISEQNFFDEDNEPMKMNEVLSEICKWCNLTAVCNRTAIYFVDYDAIRYGYNGYIQYTVGSTTPTRTITLTDNYNITSNSFMKSGTTLTQDVTYSKVTIKDSLYDVDTIMPPMFENQDLVNCQDYPDGQNNWYYTYSTNCKENDKWFNIKSRHYTNKRFNHYYYNNDGTSSTGPIYNGLAAEQKLGASFSRYNIGKGDTTGKAYNDLSYDFKDYLMVPINNNITNNLKRLETKVEFAKPFFISGNTKFIVKGNMILTDRGTFNNGNGGQANIGYFPDTQDIKGDYNYSGWWIFSSGNQLKIKKKLLTVTMGLNIGDSSIKAEVPFYEYGEGEEWLTENKKNHEIFYNAFEIQNNVTYNDKIDEKGYKMQLNISNSDVIAAKPIVSIYGMDNFWSGVMAEFIKNPISCLFIQDFDIIASIPHEGGLDENDTDTEYTYSIDTDYVSELDDIEFKICTWDNKQLNYSAVAYPYNGAYRFVDTLYSPQTGKVMRSEQIMGWKIVEQYRYPAKKLNINLVDTILPWTLVYDSVTSCNYIVDNINRRYVEDSCEYNLTQKF